MRHHTLYCLMLETGHDPIEVFHTRDQNHVTAGAAPFWGSSSATAAVAAVDMI